MDALGALNAVPHIGSIMKRFGGQSAVIPAVTVSAVAPGAGMFSVGGLRPTPYRGNSSNATAAPR